VAPFGSEAFAAVEHVPDRLGQSTGEVDLGDLGAALLADAGLRLLVAVAIGRCGARVRCCFDERPAHLARALLAQRSAQVALAGLVDARAEAAVASKLARRGEATDVADFSGDRVGEHPADPRHGAEQGHVAVVGAEPAQLALAARDLLVELVD
jgi:hypothetical protein